MMETFGAGQSYVASQSFLLRSLAYFSLRDSFLLFVFLPPQREGGGVVDEMGWSG